VLSHILFWQRFEQFCQLDSAETECLAANGEVTASVNYAVISLLRTKLQTVPLSICFSVPFNRQHLSSGVWTIREKISVLVCAVMYTAVLSICKDSLMTTSYR